MSPPLEPTARHQFEAILQRNVRRILRVVFSDILNDDYKPNVALVGMWVQICIFLISCVNTIIVGEIDQKIETISYLAICLQGPTKLYTAIEYRMQYIRLIECCRNVYRSVERTGSAHLQRQTETFSLIFCRILNAQCILVIIAGSLLIAFPVIAYVVMDMHYVPIMPLLLPFVDRSDIWGYWLNNFFWFFATVTGVCGILPSDSVFLILVLHAYVMKLVLAYDVDQMNAELQAASREKTSDGRTVRMANFEEMYHKLIDMHSEYFFYTQDVSTLYYYISSVEVYTDGLSMCSLIYIIMMTRSYPAYGLFLVMLSKLLLFTLLGMILDIANDAVYASLMSIEWYRMNITQMRNMVFVTQIAQNAIPLKAGVANLNLSLFLDIMKTVYTIAMMLVKMDD